MRFVLLQCVAVCCSVLQCVVVCCSVLQCVSVCHTVLQYVVVCCSMLQCVVDTQTHKNSLYYIKRANERQFLSKETQIPFILKMPFYEKSSIFYQKRYSIKRSLYILSQSPSLNEERTLHSVVFTEPGIRSKKPFF